jgi:hypothetical protein
MASTNTQGAEDDESEWEYEYDDKSTEDFYLTLDLTTHIPPALARDRRSKTLKANTRASNKSLANAPGSQAKDTTDPNDHDQGTDTTAAAERMQIVGLHEKNPIISYNNAIYSCQWATDLATQIFLAPPPAHFDPEHTALRSTPSFDVLGTSCARLVALPASIQPKVSSIPSPTKKVQKSLGLDTSYTTAEGDVIQQTTAQGLRIGLPSTASAQRTSQAKFLEALSAIKARRGDTDAVPVTNIKVYHAPKGWEEERAEWIEKESARSKKDKAEAVARAKKEKAEQTARLSRQNRRPAYRPTRGKDPSVEQEEEGEEEEEEQAEEEEEEEDATNKDGTTPAVTRVRRPTRGGARGGGAPSGRRLRQSLGLPEARRDSRPKAQPRKKRKVVEAATTEHAPADGPSQDDTSPQDQVEQSDTVMEEGS